MATAINDIESVRITEAGIVYSLEKGGGIRLETSGNDIIFYQAGKRFLTLAYTAFTTPAFTSAEDGRSQIEAMLAAATGASNPAKAEDSVHASADIGNFVLAVRNDENAAGAPTVLAGTSGDYIPFTTDSRGALWVRIDRSTTLTTVGSTVIVDVVFSGDGAAYVTGDVIGATQTITAAMRENAGTGTLQSIRLLSEDDVAIAIDVVIFQNTQSLGTDNAAVSISDANARDILGHVNITTSDYVDLINSQEATVKNIGLGVQAAAGTTDLYVGLIARGGGTFTTSGLRLRMTFLQD